MAIHSLIKMVGRLAAAAAVLSTITNAAAAFPTFHLSALTASAKKARIKTEPGFRPHFRHAYCYGEGVPIYVEQVIEAQNGSGITINCSVTVDQVPTTGTSVQINCDRPDLVASPSGSWPYILNYPAGSPERQSVIFAGRAEALTTQVRFYAAAAGVDISDPANWTATSTLPLRLATSK